MIPNERMTHYLFLLRKAEDSPFGMQLRPYEAGELADQIGELLTVIRNQQFQIAQLEIDNHRKKP